MERVMIEKEVVVQTENDKTPKEDMPTTTALAIVLLFAVLYLFFSNYQMQQKLNEISPVVVLDVSTIKPKAGYTKEQYERDYQQAAEHYKSLGFVVLNAETVVAAPSSIIVELE